MHRAVDASDKLVYVWTSFEPDEARRAWACFDQPDLKAVHGITVTAPEPWIVLSNTGDAIVEDAATGRRWTFHDTPPLSTYVPVVNAGPFHERRAEHGGHDLGLYARQSLAPCLDRDADELFALTAAGLAYFGEQFGMPFPQRRYDQVWVPDMGGAMENYGCVTWGDALMYRSDPTHAQRELRASVLMHEMAHMWFGDIVTMRWWDDLWLNEAFAEWAANWAVVASTEHTDAWASFLTGAKVNAYRADRASTTHPIRQPVNDVAEAMAGFDHITYSKGASVLKQLVAYVGEDDFVAGLRSYFQRFAWANASLDDLVAELEATSGLDLGGWVQGWLETSGTDDLIAEHGRWRAHAARNRAGRRGIRGRTGSASATTTRTATPWCAAPSSPSRSQADPVQLPALEPAAAPGARQRRGPHLRRGAARRRDGRAAHRVGDPAPDGAVAGHRGALALGDAGHRPALRRRVRAVRHRRAGAGARRRRDRAVPGARGAGRRALVLRRAARRPALQRRRHLRRAGRAGRSGAAGGRSGRWPARP